MQIPKGVKPKRMKQGRVVDKDHLSFIRELPCFVCLSHPPNAAHHILRGVLRGTGLKAGDDKSIPLCHVCHNLVHHVDGNEYRVLGTERAPELAQELYKLTGNHSAAVTALCKWRIQNGHEL